MSYLLIQVRNPSWAVSLAHCGLPPCDSVEGRETGGIRMAFNLLEINNIQGREERKEEDKARQVSIRDSAKHYLST